MQQAPTSSASTTTGDFAAAEAAKLLGRLAAQIDWTIQSCSAGAVHDLRVQIRKFLCVLTGLKACFPRNGSKLIRRRLTKFMARAGCVRDCDIAIQLAARLEPSSSSLIRQLRTEREEAAQDLIASLNRWVRRGSRAEWLKTLEGDEGCDEFRRQPVNLTAMRILSRLTKKYFRLGKEAARDDDASEEDLHRFRIAAKNVRYTLDLFAPGYGDSLKGLLRHAAAMQTRLGEVNDCATVRRMLSRRGGDREIVAALEEMQRGKAAEYRQAWAAARSSGGSFRYWKKRIRSKWADQPE